MALDSNQLATLRAAILAETDPAFVALRNAGATAAMADWYNQPTAPAQAAWDSAAPVDRVLNQVDQAAYTPADTADGTALYTNRTLLAQTKLMVLQNLTLARQAIDARLATVRKSLRDAVINLPTAAGGGNQQAAGASGALALVACTRTLSKAEALFVTGSATTGTVTAALVSWEGVLTDADVVAALTLV